MLSPREQVIENFGQYFEQYKLSRILGRVYGLLLITDQPYLGLDQMVTELNVSKASVSTTARQLISFTMIEKVTRPGDRCDYYRISSKAAVSYLQSTLRNAMGFANLIDGAARLEDLQPDARAKIEKLQAVYTSLAQILASFFAALETEEQL